MGLILTDDTPLLKDPDESEVFNFDFGRRLATGEAISGANVVATPSGLTVGTPAVSGAVVQVRLSAGTAGTTYHLTCNVTTSQGNSKEIAGDLKVLEY